MTNEGKGAMLEDIANQMMANGAYKPADNICEEIEKLGKDHVVAAAKKLFSGKTSLAVVGDCSSAPYLDELM